MGLLELTISIEAQFHKESSSISKAEVGVAEQILPPQLKVVIKEAKGH